MTVQKLSTRLRFDSSLLLSSLAEEFDAKRDTKTMLRLLAAISATNDIASLDIFCVYLKETIGERIDPDWDEYLKTVAKDKTPSTVGN